MDAECFNEY